MEVAMHNILSHPFYPTTLELDGYTPLVADFTFILGVFFVSVATVGLGTWFISGKYKHLTNLERMICCWLMVTGSIHFVIEGYVVVNANYYKDTAGNYLSDAWKEYTKADSRYASRDSFVIAMETVTAFMWGPLCPLTIYGIFNSKSWRYVLMIVISVGQIYGDVLYYATCFLEDFIHHRPEPLYFWGYFVVLNGVWIVIPGLVLLYAAYKSSFAVHSMQRGIKSQKLQ